MLVVKVLIVTLKFYIMSNKPDVNIQKNTFFNFQIGLIASLLFTYLMFEVYSAAPVVKPHIAFTTVEEPPLEWQPSTFRVYKEPNSHKAFVKRERVVDPHKSVVVDDQRVVEKVEKGFRDQSSTSLPISSNMLPDEPDEEPDSMPFIKVEVAPIFPGCEILASNQERAHCFSENIGRIIARKFNTNIGEKYGLKGVQRIYAQFDVDQDGFVKNILMRAPHPKLEKEARRVIDLFPKMTPAKQRGRSVTVKYQLPIVFKVQY